MSDRSDDAFLDRNASAQSTPRESSVPNKGRNGRDNGVNNSSDGDQSSDSSTEIVFVDKKCLSSIIGRHGKKIEHVRNASGAKINIPNKYAGAEVPISLSGIAREIQTARDMIKEINQSTLTSIEQENAACAGLNWIEKTIIIPNVKSGTLIGRGGSKIKALEEKSGAKIDVKSIPGGNYRCYSSVVIRGDENCIMEAESLIYDTIKISETVVKYITKGYRESLPKRRINIQALRLKQARKQLMKSLEPITKNFYIEDSAVAHMLPNELEEWTKKNNISVTDVLEKNPCEVLNPVLTFEQAFNHYPEILDTICNQNFKKPSPIQSQVWPLAMRGYDVIGVSQTGSGKTLAYLLPALIHIGEQSIPRTERKGPSCLILTPTTELALLIEMEIKKYHYRDIQCACVYSVDPSDCKKQRELAAAVEIIVATPARLKHLVFSRFVSLDSVTFVVFDEADQLLNTGHERDIVKIMWKIRLDRQILMMSSTWPEGVQRSAKKFGTEPMQVKVGLLDLGAVHTVKQIVEVVAQEEKNDRLLEFVACMKENDKVLICLWKSNNTYRLSDYLRLKNISCQSIHGARLWSQRKQALDDFKTGRVRILIARDVSLLGVDVGDITHVFNYDVPNSTHEYVRRVGRAGKSGTCVTLVTKDDCSTAEKLIDILVEAQQNVPAELQDMVDRFVQIKESSKLDGGLESVLPRNCD